jgi:hypothetical protein
MFRKHFPHPPATPKPCDPHRGRDHGRDDDHCKRRKQKHCKPHHHHKSKKSKHCR